MRSGQSPAGRVARPPQARWSAVLSWSMVAAVVVHVLVFAFSPSWTVPFQIARGGSGMALLAPVPAARAPAGPAVGGLPRPPDAREPDVQGPARAARFSERSEGAWKAIELPSPSIVEPAPAASDARDLRLSPLVLPHRSSSRAQLQSVTPDGLWRDILNVDQVLSFLRARYNGLLETTGVRGYAVIQVWVDARGRVAHSEVHDSSGSEALDLIALELFEEVVRFQPRRSSMLTSAQISIPFQGRW